MKILLPLFIGLFFGAAGGYLLLRVVLPPILSRMLDVRERYLNLRKEVDVIREKIETGKVEREDLLNEIDNYFSNNP